MFDVAGIEKSLRGGQKLPLRECATRLQSSVQAFAGSHELQDDQTLLLIRRVG